MQYATHIGYSVPNTLGKYAISIQCKHQIMHRYVGTNEAPHPKDEIRISKTVENVCRKCMYVPLYNVQYLVNGYKNVWLHGFEDCGQSWYFLETCRRGEEHSPGGGWAECCSLSEVMNLKWNKILLVTFFGGCNGIFIKYLARCRVAFGGCGAMLSLLLVCEHCSSVTVYSVQCAVCR